MKNDYEERIKSLQREDTSIWIGIIFIFTLLLIGLGSLSFHIQDTNIHKQAVEVNETLYLDKGYFHAPAGTKIACDQGIDVIDYGRVGISAYGCLNTYIDCSGRSHCVGEGKSCIITRTEYR